MYVCMYVCMCVCVRVCMKASTVSAEGDAAVDKTEASRTSTTAWLRYVCMSMYVCVYVCMYVCVCACVYEGLYCECGGRCCC